MEKQFNSQGDHFAIHKVRVKRVASIGVYKVGGQGHLVEHKWKGQGGGVQKSAIGRQGS